MSTTTVTSRTDMDTDAPSPKSRRHFWARSVWASRAARLSSIASVPEHGTAGDGTDHDVTCSPNRRSILAETLTRFPTKWRSGIPWAAKVQDESPKVPEVPEVSTVQNEHEDGTSRFFELPVELQLMVVCELDFDDLRNVRASSRYFDSLVVTNQAHIVRTQVVRLVPSRMLQLYPSHQTLGGPLDYLGGLINRHTICTRLAGHVADHVSREIFRRTTAKSRRRFARQHERMRQRMIPLLDTLFHYFETYRAACVHDVMRGGSTIRMLWGSVPDRLEEQVLDEYEPTVLLEVVQMYKLLLAAFSRRLRPPTYAGRLERSLRGWSRDGPSDEALATVLVIGGLREVERLWALRGYDCRRRAIDDWLETLHNPNAGSSPKPAMMARLRRRSSGSAAGRCGKAPGLRPHSSPTARASGLPMAPLSRAELEVMLPYIPSLGWRWPINSTAEELLLLKGAIRSWRDIKCPGRFINELIAGGEGEEETTVLLSDDVSDDSDTAEDDGN